MVRYVCWFVVGCFEVCIHDDDYLPSLLADDIGMSDTWNVGCVGIVCSIGFCDCGCFGACLRVYAFSVCRLVDWLSDVDVVLSHACERFVANIVLACLSLLGE